MPATESKKQIGIRGEDLACAELQRQGMQILERNWRCRLGEPNMLARSPIADMLPAWQLSDSHSRPRTPASLYVRLCDKPDETCTSLETQEQQLRQLASEHGLTVVNVHKDPGYSGALRDRPGFLHGSTMPSKLAAAIC